MEASRSFQVANVTLQDVEIDDLTISISYLIDGDENTIRFEYERDGIGQVFSTCDANALRSYAVSLAVICTGRFGAVIPRTVDVREHSPWIDPSLLDFLRYVLPRHWSEHRYQLGRLDYRQPDIAVDEKTLGSKVELPIFGVEASDVGAVMVASGSGKDSLLCEALLEHAGIPFEPFTYFHDTYGDIEHQRQVFGRIRSSGEDVANILIIRDDYERWLEARMDEHGIADVVTVDGRVKPFRTEAGEVFAGSFAMIPLQLARGVGVQAFGNERSADFPNIVDSTSGEEIAHQFAKSYASEAAVDRLYQTLFRNIHRVSLTKPIYDVTIFETLFSLTSERPYLTNSCNHRKPWCNRCEKCLYVFAGFIAFGDHHKTVEAFGQNLFDVPDILPVWEDLLGLNDRIAWECVGHPEEAQLYLYRARSAGLSGCAIDMFDERIWTPLVERLGSAATAGRHFDDIYTRYTVIDDGRHHMPEWLAPRVVDVVQTARRPLDV